MVFKGDKVGISQNLWLIFEMTLAWTKQIQPAF